MIISENEYKIIRVSNPHFEKNNNKFFLVKN